MKRATALKVLAGTLVLVMVASAFPLADIVLDEIDERKAAEQRAPTGAPTAGDLPFVPGAEGSVFAPVDGAGAGSTTGQGGSSSRPGPLPATGQAGASGSALIDQILGAAQLMGHDVQVPPLPLDQVATEAPLRAAILAWIATTGAQVPPEELTRELARADAMPIGLQRDLALLLLSASQATVLQHAALAELTDEQLLWIYSHPEVAQDLVRGVETPETRYMAMLAGLVDTSKSIEASLLLLQAVDATRGSLSQHEAQRMILGLQAGDVDAQTSAVLALLASGGSRVSDSDKVRFAAEIVATTSGIDLPARERAESFAAAVEQLVQATGQAPASDELAAVLARADLLPLDLQQAVADLLVAQAAAVDASDPARYTPTGQAQALAGVLLAVADSLPVLEKYNLYWRGAPDALRVSQWQPALRVGWAAEHAAMLRATHADPVDLVRAGGILHGAALADAQVPSRSFADAYVAAVEASGLSVSPEVRAQVAAAGDTLSPAVRDAAAHLMSGAAESARLHKAAFAAVSAEDARFLLTQTHGLDALYLASDVSEADLARLARASAIAAHVDLAQLTAAAIVGARATSEARDMLAGEGAYATQGVATPVPVGLRAFLARLLPFGTASAQAAPGACQDLGPARDQFENPQPVSSDCANDVLLRLEMPIPATLLVAQLTGGRSNFCFIVDCFTLSQGSSPCNDRECVFPIYEANSELLVITGTKGSVREPLTGLRQVCLLDGTPCTFETPRQYGAPLVSLDLGGADTYTGPVAVPAPNATAPVSLHLDMGGADYYADPSALYDARSPMTRLMGAANGHPTQASAYFGGVAVLLDAGGDDRYDAQLYSQGFGRYGAGLLADLGGADAYTARGVSQGAATDSFNLGVGILADAGGNDRYRAGTGQGYGLGGLLLDVGGVDVYSNDHDANGAPMAKLDVLPGGNVTTLHERGDNKVWLDGPGTLSVGIAVDTEVTLSGRDGDGDGDSDFLEFLAGSDPENVNEKALDGPNARVSKVLVDTDKDLFPDFVERAFSTDPKDAKEYPAGFPVGPEFLLPAETRSLLGDSLVTGDALDGVDGPRDHDKILDLRVPLQDAGTIDHGCVGPVFFNGTAPFGLFSASNVVGVANPLAPSTSPAPAGAEGPQPKSMCVTVSYDTQGAGQGNATLPSNSATQPSQFTFRLPAGILAIGDSVKTSYAEDYFVAIDLGGDDAFANSAGGALLVETRPKEGTGTNAAFDRRFLAPSLVVNVDPANYEPRVATTERSFGKDVYANETRDLIHGALFGVLVDTGGDDRYIAGNGSQGSVGGVLLDLRDNDTYVAANLSQGATLGGTPSQQNRPGYPSGGATPSDDALARRSVPALLLDLGAGNDRFTAGMHSQGFARGMAVTCESEASVPCPSRNAPVPAGVLLNLDSADSAIDGNDVYDTATTKGANSQGVASQGGLGVLLDAGGARDIYRAWGIISQGSVLSQAFHTGDRTAPAQPRPGLGALLDTTGSDLYFYETARGPQSRNERSNNLTVSRYETTSTATQTAYLDVGLHLDAESSDAMLALGGVGGVGGSTPNPTAQEGFALQMPSARLAIGTADETRYDREYAFVVDLGGPNVYEYSAAGFIHDMVARGAEPTGLNTVDDPTVALFPVTFLLDAGQDASKYNAGRGFSQGAGLFSTGVLVDLGGRDAFVATPEIIPTIANDWLKGNLIVDGTIGETTEWGGVTKREIDFVSVRDARIKSTMTMWMANDQQNLAIALQGQTLSEGVNRTRDVLVIDLDPGHRMREWDHQNGTTGIDQLVITWQSANRCTATDRHYNRATPATGTRFIDDNSTRGTTHAIACRMLEDGRFFIELRKQLTPDVPLDEGDVLYRYDEDRGFDKRELGFRLEFREAGTGYGGNTVSEHYVYTYPAGTTNLDGALTFRKGGEPNANLSDEMAAWAVTTLANLGESGKPALHTRVPSVSQAATVSGVGILAMLGTGESQASLVASDRAQAYASYGGFAALLDAGGSDSYSATRVVQGAAEQSSLALFLELEGNDNFLAGASANGWNRGGTNAAGVFLDLSGDDEYRTLAPDTALPTGGPADLPPGAPLPPGNQRLWARNESIGIDHQALQVVRGTAFGALMNTAYNPVRTDLAVTVYEPNADDADASGCTPRPVAVSAAVQKPIVSGKVCLRASVSYNPRGAVAGINNGTINVTSVDFFADRIRLGTSVAGQPILDNRSLFQAPVELAAVQDGVTRLKALASFTVTTADGTVYAFSDQVSDDVASNATKVVLVNNLPQPRIDLSPRFNGAANSTFSPNAYGDKRQLLVNWTVPHDADEDRLDAYMGWSAPARLSNVPCKGSEGRLCNLLPFYLTGDGQRFATTPGSKLAGDTSTQHRESHDGARYSQTTDALTTDLRILANGSFRLAIPNRDPIYPVSNDYTTHINISVVDATGSTVVASGRFTSTQAPTVGNLASNTAGGAYDAVRDSLKAQIDRQTATLEDNPFYNVMLAAMTRVCTPDPNSQACGAVSGDYGRTTALRACTTRSGNTLNLLVPVFQASGLCTTLAPANASYMVANESGPIVNGAIEDITGLTPFGSTNVSNLGQTVSDNTDILQAPDPSSLNWRDFFLDVNQSLVGPDGVYKVPAGSRLKLEFHLTASGLNVSTQQSGRYGQLVDEIKSVLDPLPPTVDPHPNLKIPVRSTVFGPLDASRSTVRDLDGRLSNPIPISTFTIATGPESMQPRLEVRTPAEPSTVATVTLERVAGEASAILLGDTVVEGDVAGSPTRVQWVVNESLQGRYLPDPTRTGGDRFTQRNVTFNGCCSVFGGDVEDGVYFVRVKATDASGTSEAVDTVLVDRTAPVSVVTTPSYVGAGLIESNNIPIRWTTFEAGSRLDRTYVFVKAGEEDIGNISAWTQLGDASKPMSERHFPAEKRSASYTKRSGVDTYFILVVSVDRAGNVEAAPGAESLSAALARAIETKIAIGEGAGGYSRIVVDQGTPVVNGTDVAGARFLSFQGADFYFVKAGEPVAFGVCARDPEQNGGIGKITLNLDYFDAARGETLSHAFDAESRGPCGATGYTRYEYSGWGRSNRDKTAFPDGVWAASFDVYDLAGNRVQVAVSSFVLDSKQPELRLEAPIFPAGQTAVKPGDRVSVRLFAEDEFGMNDARLRVDASALTTDANVSIRPVRASGVLYQEATILVNRADLLNQAYTVNVTVFDNAGNARTGSVSIPVDFRKFEFVPGSVQVRDVTHNSAVLTWKTTVPATSLAKFGTSPVDLRGRTLLNVTGVTEHAVKVEGLQPKTRYFLKAVSSSAGGFTNESDALEIETGSALFLRPLSPAAGSAVSGAVPVRFEGGLRDSTDFVTYTLQAQSRPDADWVFVTTLTAQGEAHTLTFNSTRYLDGQGYRLRLVAEAGKDRTEVTFGPFLSDNTLPALQVIGPLVATNDTTPRVVAEIRDNLAGFDTAPATLLIDGTPVPEGVVLDTIPGGLRVTYDVPSALPPGAHTFELSVADKAGNVVRESWKVSIDGDAPVVIVNPTGFSPGTEAAKLGGTATLNLTVKDQSGVSIVTANTSGISAGQPTTRLTRLPGTDLFAGTFPVTAGDAGAIKRVAIVATDLAGNTRTLDVEIPVDNVPPQVGEAHAVEIGHTRAVLAAKGNEPIVLRATATAPNSPAVTASTRNATADARLALEGLLPSRTYQYQLEALDRAGNAVTLAGGFETLKDTKAPTAVGPLSVIDLLNGTLRLAWAPATDDVGVAFYRVYRSEDGATFKPHAEVRAPGFDDANLPYEKQFVYQVVAVDHGANEGPSNERLRASATAVPRLTVGLVTPTVGSTSTTFRYSVTYVSPGGVAPTHMRIVLDGVAQNMTLAGGSFSEGAVYVYETRLAPHARDEPHTYSFEASDGRYTVQFPEDGSTLRGPLVSGDVAAGGATGGFAAFAQRVPVAGIAGTTLAILVAAVIVGLVVRRKKEGSQ